jgi:hypothetical protein
MSKTSFGRSESPLEKLVAVGRRRPLCAWYFAPARRWAIALQAYSYPADSSPLETESIAQADLAVESHALRERWGEWTCRAPNRRKEPELWPCLK